MSNCTAPLFPAIQSDNFTRAATGDTSSGVVVQLHDSNEVPYASKNGDIVVAGHTAEIGMEHTPITIEEPPPYTECAQVRHFSYAPIGASLSGNIAYTMCCPHRLKLCRNPRLAALGSALWAWKHPRGVHSRTSAGSNRHCVSLQVHNAAKFCSP